MEIRLANKDHIDGVAVLFDKYRQFYNCSPDLLLSTSYISERITNGESTIFVAILNGKAVGFVQLYPSFCSIDATRILILHDLFVDADARNAGIGAALMNQAADFARTQGAGRIDLMTEKTNRTGQHLYEKLGYTKSFGNYFSYSLRL